MQKLMKDAQVGASVAKALAEFESAMDDDFNTASALAAIHDMVREINTVLANDGLTSEDQTAVLDAIANLTQCLEFLVRRKPGILDDEDRNPYHRRQEARKSRNFARSDEIRDLLIEKGIILEDTKDGVRWKRKI